MGRTRATNRSTRNHRAVEAARIRITAGRGVLDETTRADVRPRLTRKLGAFADDVERAAVRFEEVGTADGGIASRCLVTLFPHDAPALVAEAHGENAALAWRRAADAAGRMLQRALRGARFAAPRSGRRGSGPGAAASAGRARHGKRDDAESGLIDRRVGHAAANLERALARPEKRRRDVFVDTAKPGASGSDRAAGYGATAARNTKRRTAGMLAALEDSRTTPSRKLTRRSANRAKSATVKQRTTQLELHDPTVRARRNQASKR